MPVSLTARMPGLLCCETLPLRRHCRGYSRTWLCSLFPSTTPTGTSASVLIIESTHFGWSLLVDSIIRTGTSASVLIIESTKRDQPKWVGASAVQDNQ